MDHSSEYTPNGGFDGVQYGTGGGNVESSVPQMTPPPPPPPTYVRCRRSSDDNVVHDRPCPPIRGLVIVLTFISTVAMGVARRVSPMYVNYDPIIGVMIYNGPYKTKSTYSSAFV